MRRPPRKRPMPTCVGRDGDSSPSAQRRWTDIPKHLSFLEVHAVKNSARYRQALQEFLQHTLVAKNPLITIAKINQREISTGVQQLDRRHSVRGNVSLLSGIREAQGSFLATLPPCLPGLETPCPAKEQRPSCVVHVDSAGSGIFAAGALEHGHLPAVDGDVLLQARKTTVHSERRHPNSFFRASAPVIKCFFTWKTDR